MLENGKKYRVGIIGTIALVAGASVADLISLIPFAGTITSPIFWLFASIYLWYAGCGLLNSRRLATSLLSLIAEVVPAIQELPLTLAGIIAVLIMIRIEDKTGLKIPGVGPKTDGVRSPLYQDGRRMPDIARMERVEGPMNMDGVRAPNGGLKKAA